MSTKSTLFSLSLIAIHALMPTTGSAQDTDGDGVPDSIEAQLLSVLAPVWVKPEPEFNPPLPLEWAVRHCKLVWYDRPSGAFVADTGNTPMTLNVAMDTIQAHRNGGLNFNYRLSFKDGAYRYGNDPNDPVSWGRLQSEGRAVYGRVTGIGPNRYLVQYFMFFGWNETDTPPGCDGGNHEGGWIAVQFEVEASDPANPRIYDCVFHNHGRQTFVESPAALSFNGTHPRIYPERGTQEPWPYAGTAGFQPLLKIPFVSTNKRLSGDVFTVPCQLEYPSQCNQGWTAVREHEGLGEAYLITSVVNVGEAGRPFPNSESVFFQQYDGLYGNEWDSSCYIFFDFDTDSPAGPRYQPAMWDRTYSTTRVWDTWGNQANVSVDFSYSGVKTGSASQPVSKVGEALAVVAPDGTITITAGSSGERLTIFEPCTITANGGVVTIGQ